MKLVRSDSPEVAQTVTSTKALACWGSLSTLVCIASALGLLIALIASLVVSVRASAWLGVPVVLALNGYLLWRGRSPRLNWVLAGYAERVCVRLFVRRGKWGWSEVKEPDVLMLVASEITSMSARTVEVFLDGSKPRIVEWLVIEAAQPIAEDISRHVRPLLTPEGKQVFVANEGGRLTMEWKWCRPALPIFLQQVAGACPSVVIGHEERSELDLNGIWRGISRNLRKNLSAQERQLLVEAKRLGFGCDCTRLLSRYKCISFRKAAAYMVEIEQECQ